MEKKFLIFCLPNYFFCRVTVLTVSEIQALLELDEISGKAIDVNLVPPDENDLTDEDSDEEDGLQPRDPNHLGRGLLAQQAEVSIIDSLLCPSAYPSVSLT